MRLFMSLLAFRGANAHTLLNDDVCKYLYLSHCDKDRIKNNDTRDETQLTMCVRLCLGDDNARLVVDKSVIFVNNTWTRILHIKRKTFYHHF